MTGARRVTWLVGAVLILLISGGVAAVTTWDYASAEEVTAHVDTCHTYKVSGRRGPRERTDCRGTWTTADGQRHRGQINGADADDQGRDVPARAMGGSATKESTLALLPLWVFLGLLVLFLGYGAFVVFRRRKPPHPGQLSAYHPGGYPQPPPPYPPPYPPPGYQRPGPPGTGGMLR